MKPLAMCPYCRAPRPLCDQDFEQQLPPGVKPDFEFCSCGNSKQAVMTWTEGGVSEVRPVYVPVDDSDESSQAESRTPPKFNPLRPDDQLNIIFRTR
jgi:hypothetical protein